MRNESTVVDKFIVFKIADCLLGLPMSDVLKVVTCPPVENGGMKAMGLVQLGRHTIRVLDLHQQLSSHRRVLLQAGRARDGARGAPPRAGHGGK